MLRCPPYTANPSYAATGAKLTGAGCNSARMSTSINPHRFRSFDEIDKTVEGRPGKPGSAGNMWIPSLLHSHSTTYSTTGAPPGKLGSWLSEGGLAGYLRWSAVRPLP